MSMATAAPLFLKKPFVEQLVAEATAAVKVDFQVFCQFGGMRWGTDGQHNFEPSWSIFHGLGTTREKG